MNTYERYRVVLGVEFYLYAYVYTMNALEFCLCNEIVKAFEHKEKRFACKFV